MRKRFRLISLLVGALFLSFISSGLASMYLPAGVNSHTAGLASAASLRPRSASGSTVDPASDSVAYTLDIQLHAHAALATPTLQAQMLGEPSAPALLSSIDDNGQAIANSVEQLYPGTHDQFLQLWRSHIADYQQYLTAAVNKDPAGKGQAQQNLTQFVNDVATLLVNVNPQIDANNLAEQLTIHGNQTLSIIDALVAGDYLTAYQLSGVAYNHMTMVTSAMVPGYNP